MALQEIERKFLVTSDTFKKKAHQKYKIIQAYISSNPKRSVRIRIRNQEAFLTIKGETSESGTTRFEWEKEIALEDAHALLKLCEPSYIEKERYLVNLSDHVFEVDVFHRENEGLVLAEVELNVENEKFISPKWLGKEVTGDQRYYNAYLSKNPFKTWKND